MKISWLKKSSTSQVFVYKTLLDQETFKEAVGHIKERHPATCKGFKEISVDINQRDKNFHTLIKEPDSEVDGAVYTVNEEELKKLDEWEERYNRIEVETSRGNAFAYVLKREFLPCHEMKDEEERRI